MTPNVLRLDCFSSPEPAPVEAPPDPEALDRAYQLGLAEGFEQGRSSEIATLTLEIAQLSRQLDATREEAQDGRRAALAALTPILAAILGAVGPRGVLERLQEMLMTELSRLVENAPYKRCTIRCNPDLAAVVQSCVDQIGPAQIRVEEDAGFDGLELSVDGGVIAFDPRIVMARIAARINDLLEENPE
ncbi:FliH/SctL family protein [Paracoccus aminophilus]|uniref:Flagellar assembly protein FliH n=1 Tax=Paracoccus aminophilus JCM 7686 TaxID=1367847 RepID=S5XVM8_PARAH|nr:hypothetical protein [Paracoccus aminophilus]AGT07445.1 hypothetical protein JCM7686_0336 [Paracoccus aminophilus JCM 7686]